MNLDQIQITWNYLISFWPGYGTDIGVQAVWAETLEPLKPAHARTALRMIAESTDRERVPPSHAEFLAAYRDVERAHLLAERERELNPGACICDGGWGFVDEATNTVKRCTHCNPTKPAKEHAAKCSCIECYYSPSQVEEIRRGPKQRDYLVHPDVGKQHLTDLKAEMANVGRVDPADEEF